MNDIQPYQFEPEGTLQEEDDSKWLRNLCSRETIICISPECPCDVRAFQF